LDGNITKNPLKYYTVVNETYYKVETILKAFDVCFKSFHTLDLKYPFEAEQVWKFIEEYFYKIAKNRGDKKFLNVKTLIKDLDSIKGQN